MFIMRTGRVGVWIEPIFVEVRRTIARSVGGGGEIRRNPNSKGQSEYLHQIRSPYRAALVRIFRVRAEAHIGDTQEPR